MTSIKMIASILITKTRSFWLAATAPPIRHRAGDQITPLRNRPLAKRYCCTTARLEDLSPFRAFSAPKDVPKLNGFCGRRKRGFLIQSIARRRPEGREGGQGTAKSADCERTGA